MAIDHVSVGVANMKRSKAFYDAVLAPLGMRPVMPVEIHGQLVGVGYGDHPQKPSFWVQLPINGQPASMGNGVHVAFSAKTRAEVDAFFLAALDQGGVEDGRRASEASIIPITTAPSSAIPTATRSKRAATARADAITTG